jgi:3-hydroxypropanoate dehydrogenase
MTSALEPNVLDQLFNTARTHNAWQKRDVSDALLHQLVNLLKMGPTSVNCSPARFVFVRSADAKARLKPHLMEGNVEKTMLAPVTAIVATDYRFYDHLPKLYPHTDAKSWFTGNKASIMPALTRNSSRAATSNRISSAT